MTKREKELLTRLYDLDALARSACSLSEHYAGYLKPGVKRDLLDEIAEIRDTINAVMNRDRT